MPTGSPDHLEPHVDRIIREAMEAGNFDDLPGTGKPIPGAGTVDDDLWWVRDWVSRNQASEGDQSSSE
jgi:hypothetical protein